VLTLALDATPLLGDRTGIGVAVSGLVAGLAGSTVLSIVGYGLTTRGWRKLGAALPPGLRSARGPMPAGLLLAAWSKWEFPPVELWSGAVDVVHGTNFVVPPARRAGRIVSVWDLTAVRYPEMCTRTSLRYPGIVMRAVEGGAWVHTGSRSVAEEIMDHFRVPEDRVRVVPPGLSPRSVRSTVGTATALVQTASSPVETGTAPYVLGLGTTEPRKDFIGLVAAFDSIASDHPGLELLIAGPEGWAEAEVATAISRAANRERIRRVGWVDDTEALIAGATVFAYPSLYEGFGLPPLEAMSLGIPVVASAAGAVPEVVGEGALLVPPGDVASLAAGIESALTDSELRARLVAAGRARAAAFTWEASAEAMHAVYRDLASA
jgi:glycosyltransferase involved in cell wall biosynthesis